MIATPSLGHFTVSVDIEIRAAREQDLPALEWMGLFTAHRDIIRKAFEAQQRGDALLLLAISGGFPVAQVWIDFTPRRDQKVAKLWAIRTFFPLQGRGIGRCMMQVAEEEVRRRGITSMELEVERGNTLARKFYSRLGWRLRGEAVEQFDVTEADGRHELLELDLWTMEKSL